jgi:hypothetical protein
MDNGSIQKRIIQHLTVIQQHQGKFKKTKHQSKRHGR